MLSAVSSPTPFKERSTLLSSSVGLSRMSRFCAKNVEIFFNLLAFCLKKPVHLTSSSNSSTAAPEIVSAHIKFLFFSFPIACSTLSHFACWVRIAPTTTSKGVSAGHQYLFPNCLNSLLYTSISVSVSLCFTVIRTLRPDPAARCLLQG